MFKQIVMTDMKFKYASYDIDLFNQDVLDQIYAYGNDILFSSKFEREKDFLQHGHISVYEHSFNVAYISLYLVDKFHMRVDKKSLVRGALLHDYFLYDWHDSNKEASWHAFSHPTTALKNALCDFELNDMEKDIIKKHMFPLCPAKPNYKESMIVCIADKISASMETIYRK